MNHGVPVVAETMRVPMVTATAPKATAGLDASCVTVWPTPDTLRSWMLAATTVGTWQPRLPSSLALCSYFLLLRLVFGVLCGKPTVKTLVVRSCATSFAGGGSSGMRQGCGTS
eukprot:487124-Prymnesium_polylepis.1